MVSIFVCIMQWQYKMTLYVCSFNDVEIANQLWENMLPTSNKYTWKPCAVLIDNSVDVQSSLLALVQPHVTVWYMAVHRISHTAYGHVDLSICKEILPTYVSKSKFPLTCFPVPCCGNAFNGVRKLVQTVERKHLLAEEQGELRRGGQCRDQILT